MPGIGSYGTDAFALAGVPHVILHVKGGSFPGFGPDAQDTTLLAVGVDAKASDHQYSVTSSFLTSTRIADKLLLCFGIASKNMSMSPLSFCLQESSCKPWAA